MLENCPAVDESRMELGIKDFLDTCLVAGRSRASAFEFYIMGFDHTGAKVDHDVHMSRGASLSKLTEDWLSVWEDPDNL